MKLWRDFSLGIENLVKWAPVIWRDRDWDQFYLYEILKFKLTRMEQYFREYGHHLGTEKDANNISKVLEVLHRLIEEDHGKEVFEEHDKKWGESSIEFIDSDKEECKLVRFDRAGVKTKEDEEQQSKEFRECMKEEERLIVHDLNYVFDMLKKHIREWWD